MAAQDVFETVSSDETPPPRRGRSAIAVLIVVLLAAGFVGLRWSQRPTGWTVQQSRYSSIQRGLVPGLDACVQVELSGMLKYERSSAADLGDQHFRDLQVNDAAMEVLFYASCARGADLIELTHIRLTQAWADTDGRALDRRASAHGGPLRGASQYNSGWPIQAHGVTGRGKICLRVTPSLIAQKDGEGSFARLHPVTVCATDQARPATTE